MERITWKLIYFVVSFYFISMSGELSGQENNSSEPAFPSGITVAYGIGHYSIKDKYISGEKYTGPLPYYSLSWAKRHDKYTYILDMSLRYSDDIRNYNVTTEITQFTLNHGFLYPLKKSSLFGSDLFVWLGPSSDFFILYNKPKIAVSGFDYAQSFAILFSLGFNANAIYRLNGRFSLESSVNLSLLSLGFRSVDTEEDDRSPVRPLTSFTGLNSSFNLGLRYYLLYHLSVGLAYRFEYSRISSWEMLNAASDDVVVSLNYRF